MPSRDRAALDVRISAPDLSKLAKDLKAADKELLKELRKGMRAAAQPALSRAKSNASFSRRIPGAITISVTFPARGARVRVRVNSAKAPHGRAIENGGKPGTFRHPVFGNRDRWVDQPARPFFWPAMDGAKEDAAREIERVADEVTRKAGFK